MREEALSENAKKVGIVVTDDAIILSGTVANRAEKVTLENLARSMAGKKKVYNRLSY